MAVKFQEVDDKLRKTPLTEEELNLIESVENYIDEKLNTEYKGEPVWIELSIVNFQYDPAGKYIVIEVNTRYNSVPEVRRKMMREELERRYRKAGWEISVHLDDGLDGPNMSGPDYWKLSGAPIKPRPSRTGYR